MLQKDIYETLKKQFGDKIISFCEEENFDPFIEIAPDAIFDIGLELRDRDNLSFDFLNLLSGTDLGADLGVVLHLHSTKLNHNIVIKTKVPKDNPKLPTLERVWRTADWHERETFDMYGVEFEGHHNLIRILCPYDWEGFPLRKDYKTPEEYHGMRVPY